MIFNIQNIMPKEIERKFLVNPNFIKQLNNGIQISQGYIQTVDKTAVRARVKGERAFLTIKGESKGMTCSEFEYEIPVQDANDMIEELCSGHTVDKMRYEINHEEHLWEVDVFYGENEGLVVAEVELLSETENVVIPKWITEEVTGQAKYFNSALLVNPYSQWKK